MFGGWYAEHEVHLLLLAPVAVAALGEQAAHVAPERHAQGFERGGKSVLHPTLAAAGVIQFDAPHTGVAVDHAGVIARFLCDFAGLAAREARAKIVLATNAVLRRNILVCVMTSEPLCHRRAHLSPNLLARGGGATAIQGVDSGLLTRLDPGHVHGVLHPVLAPQSIFQDGLHLWGRHPPAHSLFHALDLEGVSHARSVLGLQRGGGPCLSLWIGTGGLNPIAVEARCAHFGLDVSSLRGIADAPFRKIGRRRFLAKDFGPTGALPELAAELPTLPNALKGALTPLLAQRRAEYVHHGSARRIGVECV